MAEFECNVVRIDGKENHPNADRLTIYKIGGYTCISNKLEDGSDRYEVGDLVVYIPENAVLPKWLLKTMGFWDNALDKGLLNGKEGNRVKALKLRGVFSEGLLYPCETLAEHDKTIVNEHLLKAYGYNADDKCVFHDEGVDAYTGFIKAVEGEDVSKFLGITKYEPTIPANMGGDVFNGGTEIVVKYDVEPIQKHMEAFEDKEYVEYINRK